MKTPTVSLRFRLVRAVRRLLRIDRERRWNREYKSGNWERLRQLDELAHHAVLAGYVRRLKPRGAVLDVGCGEGLFHEMLGADGYAQYLGIDFAEPVRLASVRANANTRFEVFDMNDFVTAEKFDAIVFDESIYYSRDVLAALRRYSSMLNTGGLLLISMHRTPKTIAVWSSLDAEFEVIDAVVITNAHDVSWTVKALVPAPA